MITFQTKIIVKNFSGKKITDFLLKCNDELYQKWWPKTHLKFHTIKSTPNHVGDIVYMDEYIGKMRLKMKGVVLKAIPGKKIVCQMIKFIKLPILLSFEMKDIKNDVQLIHTINFGYKGIGKILDPLFKLFIPNNFAKEMDKHVKTEFPKLRDVLHKGKKGRG